MLSIVQGWVRFALPVGGERTFPSLSQSSGITNPPFWYAQGRVAVPATLPHGVKRGKSVRSGPSGSANSPFWYAGGRVAVPVILPLGGERTFPSRSQSSGSANSPFWYAGGRVAVPATLPLGGERTSPSRSQSSGSATCGIRETDAARTALAQGVACNHRGYATRGPVRDARANSEDRSNTTPRFNLSSSRQMRRERPRFSCISRRRATMSASWAGRRRWHAPGYRPAQAGGVPLPRSVGMRQGRVLH